MNYQRPELLVRLAAEYVMGTMPVRARRRFEHLMRDAPAVRRAVRLAEDQLLPFAAQLPPRQPPDRVWLAIERRVRPLARTGPQDDAADARADAGMGGWWRSLVFWRSGALVALGLFLALGVTQFAPPLWQSAPAPTAGMGGLAQSYVAVLSDRGESPAYLVSAQRYQRDVHVKVLRPQVVPAGKVLRLWALPAGGEPTALGDLPLKDKGRLELVASAEDLLSRIPFLGISVEAAGSAPTRPSGEFVYRGPCVKLW